MTRALGGFVFLLLHELRLAFRTRSDPQRRGRLIIMAILAMLLLGVSWTVANVLAATEPGFDAATLTLTSVGIFFVTTLMVGHALIAATEAVYTRGDLDLLLSSPVSSWTVMTVRALGIAVRVATVYVALCSGVLVSLAILGAWQWLAMGPALIGLALFATSAGLVAAMILFATIGPRATRVAAQVIGALIGASIVLIFQLPNLGARGDRGAAIQRAIAALNQFDLPANHPLFVPARAFMGDTQALLVWSIGGVVTFFVAAFWFSRRFASDAAAVLSLGPKRRATSARARPFRGGVTIALLLKEWRLLMRDPVLLSQILLQLIYLVPLAFTLVQSTSRGHASSGFLGLMGGAIAAISASLTASLTWITVSAEDAPDLVAAAPVERGALDRGKLTAAAAPVVLLAACGAGLIAQESVMAAAWTLAGAACAAVSAGLIGVWHQEPGSRKDFRRRPRASWTAQLGQSFVGIGWAAATGFAAAGLSWIALVPGLIALGLLLALGDSRRAAV